MGILNFRVPLDSLNRISSPYGYRERVFKDKGKMRDPFASPYRFHGGIDYAVGVGNSVKAGERGRIIRASWHEKLGELVIIDHTPYAEKGKKHIYTMYGHLDNKSYKVKPGDMVEKGKVIGLSGNTGHSTGPHLHFSLIDSNTELSWGITGSTGYDSTPSLFKDPESYYDRAISAEGTFDDFSDKEISKLYEMIGTDFVAGPAPKLSVHCPGFKEFLRKIGRDSYLGTRSKVRLKLEDMFSTEFRSFFPSVELEVNGKNLGRIQTGTRVYELDVWR